MTKYTPLLKSNSSYSLFAAADARRTTFPSEQFTQALRLTLWGATLAAIVMWSAQQGVFYFIVSSWTLLSTSLWIAPCLFAAVIPLLSNPMNALVALMAVFYSTVLMLMRAGSEFVSFVALIVYAGAVTLLFVFVIMLLTPEERATANPTYERLTRYFVWFAVIALFTRLVVQVYKPMELFVASALAKHAVLEPTSAAAIEYFVRYVYNDIAAIVPLYSELFAPFLAITAVIFSALLGSVILATHTTERPVPAQIVSHAPSTPLVSSFLLVFALTDAGVVEPLLSSSNLCEVIGASFVGAALVLTPPLYQDGYSTFIDKAVSARGRRNRRGRVRFWKWRSARAMSLYRARLYLHSYGEVVKASTNKCRRINDLDQLVYVGLWGWVCEGRSSPLQMSSLGVLRSLVFLWRTIVLPRLVYRAWRFRAFCTIFVASVLLVVVSLFIGSCIWNDMDLVWAYFGKLRQSLDALVISTYPNLAHLAERSARQLLVFVLFIPWALWCLLDTYLALILGAAIIVAFNILECASGPHARNTRMELQLQSTLAGDAWVDDTKVLRELTAEDWAILKEHPDKWRVNGWSLAGLCTAPLALSVFTALHDSVERIRRVGVIDFSLLSLEEFAAYMRSNNGAKFFYTLVNSDQIAAFLYGVLLAVAFLYVICGVILQLTWSQTYRREWFVTRPSILLDAAVFLLASYAFYITYGTEVNTLFWNELYRYALYDAITPYLDIFGDLFTHEWQNAFMFYLLGLIVPVVAWRLYSQGKFYKRVVRGPELAFGTRRFVNHTLRLNYMNLYRAGGVAEQEKKRAAKDVPAAPATNLPDGMSRLEIVTNYEL